MFEKMFSRRAVICFFIITMLMLSCILRVAVVATGNYSAVQAAQSSYTINMGKVRGTVFDCNMLPLTNNSTEILAAVSPTPRAIVGISTLLSGDELAAALEQLRGGKPVVCAVPREIQCEGIAFTRVYKTNTDSRLACHVLGYADSTGHGVSGLQYSYDELLYSDSNVSAVFTVDGRGEVLGGIQPRFINDSLAVANGVVTTVDMNIQTIAETAAQGLTSGAVIVAETETAKIRAMVSMPQYDLSDIAGSLEGENAPLINRALLSYSVGSVFKPCVAAAALEQNRGGFTFVCEGNTLIIDRHFNCHKRDGHGFVDLRHALAFSCNCYFYNFAISTGAKAVYNMASALSFGYSLRIADNMQSDAGKLTELKNISNDAILANLSIGQGELLLSPTAMLTLYCAIAGNGSYYIPSLVEKTIEGGAHKNYDIGSPTRVMSADTAALLREYLSTVITEGTGTDAAPTLCTAAGKTATAQTGRYYENGVEITNSWFCGFFPAEDPQYVAIVMSDGATQKSTARIFAEIADGIIGLEIA